MPWQVRVGPTYHETHFEPWRIVHLDLTEMLPALPSDGDIADLFVVFWCDRRPVGQQLIPSNRLPLSPQQVHDLAATAIGRHVAELSFAPSESAGSASAPNISANRSVNPDARDLCGKIAERDGETKPFTRPTSSPTSHHHHLLLHHHQRRQSSFAHEIGPSNSSVPRLDGETRRCVSGNHCCRQCTDVRRNTPRGSSDAWRPICAGAARGRKCGATRAFATVAVTYSFLPTTMSRFIRAGSAACEVAFETHGSWPSRGLACRRNWKLMPNGCLRTTGVLSEDTRLGHSAASFLIERSTKVALCGTSAARAIWLSAAKPFPCWVDLTNDWARVRQAAAKTRSSSTALSLLDGTVSTNRPRSCTIITGEMKRA